MAKAIDIKQLKGRDLLELERIQTDESMGGVMRTFQMYALLTKSELDAVLDMPFVEVKEVLDQFQADIEVITKPKNPKSSEPS